MREIKNLGDFIDVLEEMPPDTQIKGVGCSLVSWRGSYRETQLEPGEGVDADTLSSYLQEKLDDGVMEGWKGGWFAILRECELWLGHYGTIGKKIVGLRLDGTVEVEEIGW